MFIAPRKLVSVSTIQRVSVIANVKSKITRRH